MISELATHQARKALLGAIIAGALGGSIAAYLNIPLAWMLGALVSCAIVGSLGFKIELSMTLRQPLLLVIGIFLGEAIDPKMQISLSEWSLTLFTAVLYGPLVTVAGAWFFWKLSKVDILTGAFSTAPGALSAMTIMATEYGGDDRIVAMSHSIRLAILVSVAPAMAFIFLGITAEDTSTSSHAPANTLELITVFTGAIIGWLIAKTCRIPTPMLIGPMIASILLRYFGYIEGGAPSWLLSVALCGLGASIGCRFSQIEWRKTAGIAMTAIIFALMLIASAAALGLLLSKITSFELTALILAFAPGGVSEMCLIAIAIGSDPGFILAHHLARFFTIMALAPLMAKWAFRHFDRQKT